MRKIAFLGTGNMAAAMVSGVIARGVASPDAIICLGGKGASAPALVQKTGIGLAPSLVELLAEASVLVVAFKPYHLAASDPQLAALTKGKIVISVLAGKKLAQLAAVFPEARAVVRSMPNTPTRIGAGVTGWCSGPGLSAADRSEVDRILSALGVAIEVAENQMDALTAVSGCGPAYLFEFTAALREAAVAAGLSPEVAQVLAVETVVGSARLMGERGIAPEKLRDEVTSPNGVTFAGLRRMEAGGFRDLIGATVLTAKARSEELSQDA